MAVESNFKESTVTTSNHTVNYDLPLWEGDDVTSWLTQVNDAMDKIDSGIYDAKQSSHEVVTIAENAQKLAEETKAESDASAKIVEGYEGRLKTVEDTTAEHTTDLTNLSQRVDTQDTEIHSIKEVEQTILTDVGTLKNSVTKNTSDLETDKTSIENLQSGQESLTSDVEELQNEIVGLGRVTKLLGTVTARIGSEIASTDGTGVLHIGGLYAWVYGNGIVVVNWSGYDSKFFAKRITSGSSNTLIFDLSAFFGDLLKKARELYEDTELKFQYIPSTTVVDAFNTVGTSVVSTSGVFSQEESHSATGNTHRLLLTPSLMFTTGNETKRYSGWQVGAEYNIRMQRTIFVANKEV